MRKARLEVKKNFIDVETGNKLNIREIIEVDLERAKRLVDLNLVNILSIYTVNERERVSRTSKKSSKTPSK